MYARFHSFHSSSICIVCLLVEQRFDGFLFTPLDVIIIGFHVETAIAILTFL